MKIIAFTRVSTSEQGNRKAEDRLGLQAQMDAIKRFCDFHGYEIVAHYEEVISAKYGFEERKALRDAFTHAKRIGGIVLASKLDRLSRSVEFVGHLVNNGYPFGTVEDGITKERMMLYFKAMFAEEERMKISQRTKDALAVRKAQGKKLGGERGRERLERSKAVVQAEADAFAQLRAKIIKQARAAGLTVGQIAQQLNEQGVKTSRGGQWHASTVCNILKRIDGDVRESRMK